MIFCDKNKKKFMKKYETIICIYLFFSIIYGKEYRDYIRETCFRSL